MRITDNISQLTTAQQEIYNRNISLSGWLNTQQATSRRFSNPWCDGRMARRYREQVILEVDSDTAMTVAIILYGNDLAITSGFWYSLRTLSSGYLVLIRDTANKERGEWELTNCLFAELEEAQKEGEFTLCSFVSTANPPRTAPILSRYHEPLTIDSFPEA